MPDPNTLAQPLALVAPFPQRPGDPAIGVKFNGKTRLPVLDGLRGFAILMVVLAHALPTIPETRYWQLFNSVIAQAGPFGVNTFFVLSGFLITSLLLNEQNDSGRINLRSFFWRRTRRIFPACYTFLALIGIASLTGVIHVPLLEWLSSLAYLTDYPIQRHTWWTGHTWSLSVEEQFYLIWPALLVVAGVVRAKRLALLSIAILPLIRVATYFLFPEQRGFINIMFHTRFDVLMVGAYAAITLDQAPRLLLYLQGLRGTFIALLAGSVSLAGIFLAARFNGAYELTLGYTLTAVSIVTLLIYAISRADSLVARFLALPAMRWLGRISYSLYLWQQVFLTPLNHSALGMFPLNVAGAVAVAYASYYFVERMTYRPVPVCLPPLARAA